MVVKSSMAKSTLPSKLQSSSKALEAVNLAEIGQLAQLYRETGESQKNLISGVITETRDMLEALTGTLQTLQDLLQILTTQSEASEQQSRRMVTVALALTKATTALTELPPGSATRYENE